jgi:hypothetical protein
MSERNVLAVFDGNWNFYTMSDVTPNRIGKCTVCGHQKVLVTHPPMSRCVDMKKCDDNRALNRERLSQEKQGKHK